MKNILYITQNFPYPPYSGGKIKTLNTIQTLAKAFNVFVLCLSDKRLLPKDLIALELPTITVKAVYDPGINSPIKGSLGKLFKHYSRGIPYLVYQYSNEQFRSLVEQKVASIQPAVIHIDHINMAQYLPKKKGQAWILEEHNIEYQRYLTQFYYTDKARRKALFLAEMVLTFLFEVRQVKKFDHVFAISAQDTKVLKNTLGASAVTTQSLHYPSRGKKSVGKRKVLFIGGLNWPPNEDAVVWFCKKVFPLVKKEIPDVEFHVVGDFNTFIDSSLKHVPEVFFHGFQPNISPYLEEAVLFTLPFRVGGGVRIKALTALAHGVPIISTSLGIKGLDVRPDQEFLLANNASEFAEKMVSLLKSVSTQRRLANNGFDYLKRYHGKKQNDLFLKTYIKSVNSIRR